MFLKRFGVEIRQPDTGMLEGIRRMQYELDSIPFYDIEYRTDEEIRDAAENGYLLVAVKSDSGELCAANYSVINGKYVTGWIAVRNKYRDIPGISICLHKKAAERDSRNNHLKKTWILTNNKESLEYHNRIGFEPNGEEMDLWLMERSR